MLLAHKLRLAFEAIEEAALLPAAPRVARRLLLMAGGYGEPGALRNVLKVPQEDLAMMLALSRQTINQVLKHFETQGALKLRYAEIESSMPTSCVNSLSSSAFNARSDG
ncbi:CRP-like cAMP-binding protein [Paraburkholderia sp. MM6662-R1]